MLFRTLPAEEKGGASYDLCTWLCTWRVEESGVRARVLVQCGVHDRKKHGGAEDWPGRQAGGPGNMCHVSA